MLVREASAFERMDRLRTVVFDKTGTVTEGRPTIVRVESAEGFRRVRGAPPRRRRRVGHTIGGNDVGFSNIMTTCVVYGTSQCVAAVNQAEAVAQASLPGWLDTTYTGIRSHAPNAQVVVLSYPVFYQLGVWYCIGLSETSRSKINEGINLVDGIIKTAAINHGFTFADVRSVFVGHQLCSGNDWLHSLNISDISESYHPTASGQSGGYYSVFNSVVH